MPGLADRFRVIAIDLPGQGHSERLQPGYDSHTVAVHVHAAVTRSRSVGLLAGRPRYRRLGHLLPLPQPREPTDLYELVDRLTSRRAGHTG
jgi:pimeloyl-ACP methyl ester carboxylesterase